MSLKKDLPSDSEGMISKAFFQVALEHFPILREKGKYEIKETTALYADVFKGDFHGLLTHMRIDTSYHRIVTSFNGLKSPLDYDGTTTVILVPDLTYINRLKTVFDVKM